MASNDNNNFIGAILKQSRIAAGYTQKEIGRITGKAPQTVASWESGKSQPDISTLIIICYRYGITDPIKTFSNFFDKEKNKAYPPDLLESAAFKFGYKNIGLTDEEKLLLINFRKLDSEKRAIINNFITKVLITEPEEELEPKE